MSSVHYVPDGFLRLPLDALLATKLSHLVSGLDEDDRFRLDFCGRPTVITGYTEWVNVATPSVSLGWDWRIEVRYGQVLCVRVGLPRSNVMLIDATRHDYDWRKNLETLATIVDAIPWADETRRMVTMRYA